MAKLKEEIRKIGPIQIRAVFDPKTLNETDRTVDVVFATDKAIRMSGWDGSFDEILSMKDGQVRLERLNSGAPLLNNHDRYSGVEAVFGRVLKAWVDGATARATVKFSKRDDVEEVWQDVKDGILTGISTGYRVYEYEIVEREGQVPQYTATDWEPFEISLAPVPADYTASVRSAGKNDQNDVKLRSEELETKPLNNPTVEKTPAEIAAEQAENQRKADEKIAAERKLAVEGERKRSADIKAAVRAAKLPDEFAENLIATDVTVEKSRELIIAEFAKNDPARGASGSQAGVKTDEADKRRSAMIEAIEFRSNPSNKELAKKVEGNEFRGMSLIRMAAEAIVAAGGSIKGLADSEIARYALNLSDRAGMLSTSDFPIILGNTINRLLLAEYAIAPRTFQAWSQQSIAKDFKTNTRARFGDMTSFSKVNEGSEYKYGSVGEASEAYKVAKYGEIIAVTWETLVNDDLGAFNRLPAKIANAAARQQSDIMYAILSANANMSDGVALFHATHANLGTAGAISIDSLAEARKLLRNQKGVGALDYLNLVPMVLLVGPAYESLALQYTSSAYLPTTQSQVNPYKNLTVVVEPRITGNAWYIMADPRSIDTVEYAFLEGNGELFTETRQGFHVDGVEVKARMVFGAKAIDWRGMVKNVGA